MDVAKVTTKGQITTPKEVRDSLQLSSGSKVVFLKRGSDWLVFNPDQAQDSSPSSPAKLDERGRQRLLQELTARYDVPFSASREQPDSMDEALERLRDAFDGVAEEQGWDSDQDVVDYIKSLRRGNER